MNDDEINNNEPKARLWMMKTVMILMVSLTIIVILFLMSLLSNCCLFDTVSGGVSKLNSDNTTPDRA